MAPTHVKTERRQVTSRSQKTRRQKVPKYGERTQKPNQADNRSPTAAIRSSISWRKKIQNSKKERTHNNRNLTFNPPLKKNQRAGLCVNKKRKKINEKVNEIKKKTSTRTFYAVFIS